MAKKKDGTANEEKGSYLLTKAKGDAWLDAVEANMEFHLKFQASEDRWAKFRGDLPYIDEELNG